MTAAQAKELLEQLGERTPEPGDAVFLDTVRARIARGADLTRRQSEWLTRIAIEVPTQ